MLINNFKFLVVTSAIIFYVIHAVKANVQDEPKELKLVHVVMRHSVRAPVSTYPKDPYINQEFAPNGWGQLTLDGIKDAYKVGEFLRNRYGAFLGDKYKASEYLSQSTGVDRALATLMSVNAALWKPHKDQKWTHALDWLPVPVHSQPLDDDMLLLVRRDCPQYNIELKNVENSEDVASKLAYYKDLFKYVEEQSGQKMENFYDIEDIYSTLLAEKNYGLDLPAWVDNHFPKMEEAAANSFLLKAYNSKLKRLKGGVLVKKLMHDWMQVSSDKPVSTVTQKMFLYGGHDTTISNLLSALNIFKPQVPDYAMAVIFELYYDRETKQYGIEIYTKVRDKDPEQMTLPGCEKFCSLAKVIELTKPIIPIDWEAECATDQTDYVAPAQSGP